MSGGESRARRLLQPVRDYARELATTWSRGWARFWFSPADPVTLAAIRICTGLVLLYVHASYTPDLLEHVGPHARIDETAIDSLRAILRDVVGPDGVTRRDLWTGTASVWFHVTDPTVIRLLHGVFLAAILCFTLGLFTRTASVLVWAGNLSFVQRGYMISFGLDAITAMLTLYLMLGPSGQALSLDQVIARRRALRRPGPSGGGSTLPRESVAANIAIRLIQVHMCIVYLSAGLAKLQGSSWWDGTAVYLTLMTHDLGRLDMRWIATHDWLWQLVSSGGNVFTIALEVGFVFLVWHRLLRPLVLSAALVMHAGIALSMGLWTFSAVMLIGCLAFVPPASLRWLLADALPTARAR